MTTFAEDETSVSDSRPIELYDFDLVTTIHRLTSADADVVFGGNLYTAVPISRGNTTEVALGQVRETIVSLPVNHAVAQELIGNGIPPRTARLTITQLQQTSNETRRVWRGEILGVTTSGGEDDGGIARLRVPNATDQAFSVALPFAVASKVCNHALYDAGCALPRDPAFRVTPTVASINGIELVVSTMSGKPDQFAQFGEVLRVADGERRSVLSQLGTTITLDVPFRTLLVGDALEVWAGCDHTVESGCRDKFNNVINFGGHPELPIGNPTAPTGFGVIVQA